MAMQIVAQTPEITDDDEIALKDENGILDGWATCKNQNIKLTA